MKSGHAYLVLLAIFLTLFSLTVFSVHRHDKADVKDECPICVIIALSGYSLLAISVSMSAFYRPLLALLPSMVIIIYMLSFSDLVARSPPSSP
jgi:hypothetical protein